MVWTRSSVVTVFVIRTRLTSCSQTPVFHLLGVVVARVFPGALQLTLVSHSSWFCLLTDSGRPQHHGGCVQMVRRDFVGSGPLQAHQQLCSKHPGRGGTRCFHGETSLRGIILRDLWKSGTPNISCKLTVLHILHEPQHIPTHVPGQVAHNIHSHSTWRSNLWPFWTRRWSRFFIVSQLCQTLRLRANWNNRQGTQQRWNTAKKKWSQWLWEDEQLPQM